MITLAGAAQEWTTAEELAHGQGITWRYLAVILGRLRRARLVVSRRGAEGGYRLSRPAAEISLADVIVALEGPLTDGTAARPLGEDGHEALAHALGSIWAELRDDARALLEQTTLTDVAEAAMSKATRPDRVPARR